MLANDVLSPLQFAAQNTGVKLKLSAQCVAEFTALAQSPEEEFSSELVGLLFGTFQDNVVEVETVRQLPVQGPGLVFERFTRKHFDTILVAARLDPQLEPLQLIGWYRFHLDCDTRLLPFEIEFHEKFFPRHEHLALVVTAARSDDLCLSVCARSQDGTFSPTQHTSAEIHLTQRPQGEIAVDLQSGPLFSENTYIKAYEALDGIADRQSRRKWVALLAAITIVVGAVAGLLFLKRSDTSRAAADPAPQLLLTLAAKGPELKVSWTGGIASPKQARLQVLDGDSVDQIDVTSTFRPDHSLTLPRRSGNIQAILRVSDGYRSWETHSSLIDAGAPRPAQTAVQVSDAEKAELHSLRNENQRLRNIAAAGRHVRRPRR